MGVSESDMHFTYCCTKLIKDVKSLAPQAPEGTIFDNLLCSIYPHFFLNQTHYPALIYFLYV